MFSIEIISLASVALLSRETVSPDGYPDAVVAEIILSSDCFDAPDDVEDALLNVISGITGGRVADFRTATLQGYPGEFIMLRMMVFEPDYADVNNYCIGQFELLDGFTIPHQQKHPLWSGAYSVPFAIAKNDTRDAYRTVFNNLSLRWEWQALFWDEVRPQEPYVLPEWISSPRRDLE